MRKKTVGLERREKKRRGGRKSEGKVTCWNRKERKRSSFSAVHVGPVLHKDFFVVVLLDKGLLPWERRQWHHLNWLSLCPSETKASSHPGGVRAGGVGGLCVCVFVCDVWRGRFHVCVRLWEHNWPFFVVWPGRNIANIAVKGELDAVHVMQIIHFKGFFHMRTDMFIPDVHHLVKTNPSKYMTIEHLGGVSHLMERQRRAFDNGGGKTRRHLQSGHSRIKTNSARILLHILRFLSGF